VIRDTSACRPLVTSCVVFQALARYQVVPIQDRMKVPSLSIPFLPAFCSLIRCQCFPGDYPSQSDLVAIGHRPCRRRALGVDAHPALSRQKTRTINSYRKRSLRALRHCCGLLLSAARKYTTTMLLQCGLRLSFDRVKFYSLQIGRRNNIE